MFGNFENESDLYRILADKSLNFVNEFNLKRVYT